MGVKYGSVCSGIEAAAEFLAEWRSGSNVQGAATMDGEEMLELCATMAPPNTQEEGSD